MIESPQNHPTPEQIRAQLACMLDSEDFAVPERLKAFLSFVVQETLAGNAANIKAYTIAITAFGRRHDFDPQLDPIVRIEAGKLRKALELYFYTHPEDEVVILIPKGTYVPVFSYAKRHSEQPNPPSAQTLTPPLREMQFNTNAARPDAALEREERPTLMLLPFSMQGENKELADFLEGLNDTLFAQTQDNELVHVMEMPQRGLNINHIDVVRFAKEQGVRFVLHGQAQSSANQIRLYVALTDTQKGFRIWTEKYDCQFYPDTSLNLQDQIARNILITILDSVGVITRTLVQETSYLPPDELGVFESTLRYMEWVTSLDRDNYTKAKYALELNVVKDPHNPIILSQLSDIYSSDYQFAFNQIDNNLDRALELAKQALMTDPNCHMAKLAKGLYLYLVRDKQQLELLLKDFLCRGNVKPYAQGFVAFLLGMAVDLTEGKKLAESAIGLNPYQPGCYNVVPFIYHFVNRDYDEALHYAHRLNIPSCIWESMIMTAAYTATGNTSEATRALKRLLTLEPDFNLKRKQLLYGLFFDDKKASLIDDALKKAGL